MLLVSLPSPILAQAARVRITQQIDENQLQRLARNTHPLARSEFESGAAPANLALEHMQLVLTPSAERQQALAAFLENVHNPASPQYHKWLTPQHFGESFGVGDADIAKVSAWLASYGFQVTRVANSKTLIEFSGNASQLQSAFHTEMHRYTVNGVAHWANASDPQIPAALTPVVAGISTLHTFRKMPQIAKMQAQVAKVTSSGPQFSAGSSEYALAPGDFATIYNVNPVYQSGITGAGTTIAVVSRSNITLQDIVDFRSAFGLTANTPQVIVNGVDPGKVSGDDDEAVLDTSWSGAVAPAATVKLVVSASTNASDGVDLSEEYIVDNNLADVMTESYGDCEANYTLAEAQFYSSLASQAAAEGITYTVAAGDSGAEGCDDPGSETLATGAISVNVLAATPFNVAVGGTQFNENGNYGAYWGSSNGANGVSALTYIPENVWNESCVAAACGAANASIYAGSGGVSTLFAKPSWQKGVAGIPQDGKRDLPDIAMTSAIHDFYLLCLDGGCTQRRGGGYFSGISGTSAATPSFAGVMALIVQYTGARQGQANYKLYPLAAGETLAYCNASDTASLPASTCIFHDVTVGNNAVPGELGYGTSTAEYGAATGYDLATGLGSVNVANLVFGWNGGSSSSTVPTSQINLGIDAPATQNGTVIGTTGFNGWALANKSAISAVNIMVDSVPYGTATYGAARTDVCASYTSSNCPDVGWNFSLDTTLLANGTHTVEAMAQTAAGQTQTTSSTFNVANWTSSNPMLTSIDAPNSSSAAFSGTVHFSGWSIDSLSAISRVAATVDGISYGLTQYGGARNDVCGTYTGYLGCPNVGWDLTLDTTRLSDGPHTLAITPLTIGGQHSTTTSSFTVANNPSNVITISVDRPGVQDGAFSGVVAFGGWAVTTATPISSMAVTIDGIAYGNALFGGDRPDVCTAYPTAPSCPNVGWNFVFDSTRLPNGHHILGLRALTSTGQYATATRAFDISNATNAPAVLLGIDLPRAENDIVLGMAHFGGWAVSSGHVSNVMIAIDGVPAGTATYGGARPDVCTVYAGANCPNAGWNFAVDTTQLADGVHTMTATGVAGQLIGTLSSTFTVANWTTANPMKLSIDNPNAQTGPLSGSVGIGGWAIDQEAAIGKVTVAVDGLPLGTAFYGGARADVCSIFASAIGCPNVGWNFFLDTTLLSDGTHTLAVTGTTTAGESSTFTASFTVVNSSTDPLRVSIDVPSAAQTLSGMAPVGGWALDTSGATVVSVDVLVDGELNGTAASGGSRADVCSHFSNAAGCPNVGWNYLLNTEVFANGNHTLEVRAAGADGKQYTVSQAFTIGNQP